MNIPCIILTVAVALTSAPRANAGQGALRPVFERLALFEPPAIPPEQTGPVDTPAQAADFKYSDGGKQISFREAYKGKLVLLDFWFIDCPWCVKSTPQLLKLREKFADKGLTIIGLNIDQEDGIRRAKDYVQKKYGANGKGYMALYHADGIAESYGVSGYPRFVLVGGDGKILAEGGYNELHGEKWAKMIEDNLPKPK